MGFKVVRGCIHRSFAASTTIAILAVFLLSAIPATAAPSCVPTISWASRASVPTPRHGLAAARGTNGLVFAMGGLAGGFLSINEAYNPTTNMWSTKAAMPTQHLDFGLVAANDGKMYAIGGEPFTGEVDAYDPIADSWTTVASMPTPVAAIAATLGHDGVIYAFGGHDSGFTPVNTTYAYNPTSNTWTTRASVPTTRYDAQAVTLKNGLIYVIGGNSTAGNSGSTALTTVEVYNPLHDTWQTRAPLPIAEFTAAAVVGGDGKIYVMGGDGATGTLNAVQIYDPSSNSWTIGPSLPTARQSLAAAIGADRKIYALSGALDPSGDLTGANEAATIIKCGG